MLIFKINCIMKPEPCLLYSLATVQFLYNAVFLVNRSGLC